MATLSGPFKIDRLDPPDAFYTLKRSSALPDCVAGLTILVVTGNHLRAAEGWLTLGYVSRQTPFGQGIWMGTKATKLRRATPDEIRAALTRDHPRGPKFRPICQELRDAGFTLGMSGPDALRGWTADTVRCGDRPVVPATRKQIDRFAQSTKRRYEQILSGWDAITLRQTTTILRSLG